MVRYLPMEIAGNYVVNDAGCWIWARSMNRSGYGIFSGWRDKKKRKLLAHRLSYETYRGPIPEGLFVCHTCDVRNCVNPDHLWLGTNVENLHDRTIKGRTQRGETHYRAILNPEKVQEIRRLLASGWNLSATGRRFGVHRFTIRDIRDGETWKHVP